jgi:hypothetical protein
MVDLIGRYSNSPELPELGNTPLFRVVRSLTHGSTTPNNDLAQKPSPSSISVDGPWPGSAATTDEPTRSFATYSSAVASCAAASYSNERALVGPRARGSSDSDRGDGADPVSRCPPGDP